MHCPNTCKSFIGHIQAPVPACH